MGNSRKRIVFAFSNMDHQCVFQVRMCVVFPGRVDSHFSEDN